jgi:hypothetical protein
MIAKGAETVSKEVAAALKQVRDGQAVPGNAGWAVASSLLAYPLLPPIPNAPTKSGMYMT